jgi:DNA-binding NarL/FixJ family response regulator
LELADLDKSQKYLRLSVSICGKIILYSLNLLKMNKFIKVLVADDHPIFRHGLAALIQADKNLTLTGEAENGQIVLEMMAENIPDVIVLDLDMPILDGVATARILQEKFPDVEIVFLTMHKDRDLLKMLKPLNIKGFVLKDSALLEIADCIKKVFANKTYISPAVAELLLDQISQDEEQQTNIKLLSVLTSAERRILCLIAEAKSNREIAGELFISVRTVENHRFNICNKLQIKGNHSLIKFALANKEVILSILKK